MPYRRLPNTDISRTKALGNILRANRELEIFDFHKIKEIKDTKLNFDIFLSEHKILKAKIREENAKYKKSFDIAKKYIYHYIIVLNLAIERKEIESTYRKYYQLEDYSKKLPDLKNFDDLKLWHKKLLEGEKIRTSKESKSITNPSIGQIDTNFEICLEKFLFKSQLKEKLEKQQKQLNLLRSEIDNTIKELWDKIELKFNKYPPIIKREKTKKFGIRYFYRSNEDKIELKDLLN